MDYEAVMAMLVQKCQEEAGSPFMAAIFDERLGEILATGRNASRIDKTRHGEMEAIAEGVRRGISNWSELTLVTTAEPCCMCQGAILWTGFKRVVYGTSITTLSELGWRQIQLSASLTQVARVMIFASQGERRGISKSAQPPDTIRISGHSFQSRGCHGFNVATVFGIIMQTSGRIR